MKQRVPRRAWYRGAAGHRPRVLIEDDHPALAISDFSRFERAGFDVAFCSGPIRDRAECPLLVGQDCQVAAAADVILHNLDPRSGVAEAIRERHPAIPLLVTGDSSVPGQIEAVRRALPRQRSSPGHSAARILGA